MKVGGRALLVLAILGLAAWAALALYLGPPQSAFWALAVAAVSVAAAVVGDECDLICSTSASRRKASMLRPAREA